MATSRSKSTMKNMVFGYAYHATAIILNFVARTVFISALGKEYLGLNTLFTDVLSLLSMADLGFNLAMSYSFYKPLADNDVEKIRSLILYFKRVYNLIAVIVTGLGLACVPFLKVIVKTEQEIPLLHVYYLFALANVVITYLFTYKNTLLVADQKDYMVSKVKIVCSFTGTLLKIAVLIIWKNYILYLLVSFLQGLFVNYYASKKAEKEFPYIRNLSDAIELDKDDKNGIMSTVKSVMLYKLSMLLFNYTDNILISMLVGTAVVGVFSNYWMLSTRLILVEQIVFSAMIASVGNVIAKENESKRLEVFDSMQSLSNIFCGIITCVYGLVADDMIRVWLGEEYQISIIVVMAIALNGYFTCILHPMAIFREATGIYNKIKYVTLGGAILNIVLSVALGIKLGLVGIIIASILSRMASYFWYEPIVIFRYFFGHSAKDFFFGLMKNLILVICVFLIIYLCSSRFVPKNWMELIIKGGIIGIVCFAIFIGVYFRTPGARNIMEKVQGVFKKA